MRSPRSGLMPGTLRRSGRAARRARRRSRRASRVEQEALHAVGAADPTAAGRRRRGCGRFRRSPPSGFRGGRRPSSHGASRASSSRTWARNALSCLRDARLSGRNRSVMRTAPSGHDRVWRRDGRRTA
jgi:hypothetical protein